jgi:hypothetical protein
MSNRSVFFDGVDDQNLLSAVPGARQFSNQFGKARWVAYICGRSVGNPNGYPTMNKAIAAASLCRFNEIEARGLWVVSVESDELV